MVYFRGHGGPTPFGGFTTRTPVTAPYVKHTGWFGPRRVVPGYSSSYGYNSYRPGFGFGSSFFRPYSAPVYTSPCYAPRYSYRSNSAADAAFGIGCGAIALGVLLSL